MSCLKPYISNTTAWQSIVWHIVFGTVNVPTPTRSFRNDIFGLRKKIEVVLFLRLDVLKYGMPTIKSQAHIVKKKRFFFEFFVIFISLYWLTLWTFISNLLENRRYTISDTRKWSVIKRHAYMPLLMHEINWKITQSLLALLPISFCNFYFLFGVVSRSLDCLSVQQFLSTITIAQQA